MEALGGPTCPPTPTKPQRLGTVQTLSGKTSLHPSGLEISSPCRAIFETGVQKVFIFGQMALDGGGLLSWGWGTRELISDADTIEHDLPFSAAL